jgi:hypothetical protein
MNETESSGWKTLVKGFPWFSGNNQYPIPAYSEFMPPPRLGQSPYGEVNTLMLNMDDPFGWVVSEVEAELELQPGLETLANQIVKQIVELGQGKPAYRIAGQAGRNLIGNPYWPSELATRAGKLLHERYVVFLPLALSRTQDDKGRIRWTFFGGSEQGPERAFWKSFYLSPNEEVPAQKALSFLLRILSLVYNEKCENITDLDKIGFCFLPTQADSHFQYWTDMQLPSCIKPFIREESKSINDVRYLLTFRPFSLLPAEVRARYLDGQLVILPFPGSLVFWGMNNYISLQQELPFAMQLPLQHLTARHGGPHGIRIPQSGWFHESGISLQKPKVAENLLSNTYKRTSRWDRVHRHENEVLVSSIEDTVGRVLFSTDLAVMGLYGKPMAKNCQLWTEDAHLLLDGPKAGREELERAAEVVAQGGTFRYRFQFPAMCVVSNEIYWQRPLVAYTDKQNSEIKILDDSPLGYLTVYPQSNPDTSHPLELWPRLQRRDTYLAALHNFKHLEEHYKNQTPLNILRILDAAEIWEGKSLPRSLARQMLQLPEHETLESWLVTLPKEAENAGEGQNISQTLERCLEPVSEKQIQTIMSEEQQENQLHELTYDQTAIRAFEEAWWNDIYTLAESDFLNKDNADCVHDPATLAHLSHHHRDLERLGDYLLGRHRQAIKAAEMEGKAICGEIPFFWDTDFDFSAFGGWKNNQERHTHERNLVVIIPGKNHNEAVIMADHYDTAYMEDVYNKSAGGVGARIAAAGADDNCSATATLLQAAPVFLKIAREGLLERDIWLVHITGEEFPADCMGARHLAQALVEKTLHMRTNDEQTIDLSKVRVVGVYIMDMIGHNRDSERDLFQISPGKGAAALRLAWQAHIANNLWNGNLNNWNHSQGRSGKGHGVRSSDDKIPPIAEFSQLRGEVRLLEDPRSTLFNTDGQIFSDCGVPVVLFMENYDINRSGYHDTKDNMQNIDLGYGAALAAIVIESVARAATIAKI